MQGALAFPEKHANSLLTTKLATLPRSASLVSRNAFSTLAPE